MSHITHSAPLQVHRSIYLVNGHSGGVVKVHSNVVRKLFALGCFRLDTDPGAIKVGRV